MNLELAYNSSKFGLFTLAGLGHALTAMLSRYYSHIIIHFIFFITTRMDPCETVLHLFVGFCGVKFHLLGFARDVCYCLLGSKPLNIDPIPVS